jgi:SSS family solute:Na+ symporter
VTEARRGTIFAAYLKLLPVFIFIIPGMVALALARGGRVPGLAAMIGPNGEVLPDTAQAAFPLMVQHVMPAGLRGLVVAGLLAALMSSLAGVFNACSTLFTIDFYQKVHPAASQAHLVWVGRLATTAMVLIGLLWIPVIQGARGLYEYLQGVQGYLAPPIVAVFYLGVFNRRLNARGCLAALVVGFGLGVFRLVVDTPVTLGLDGFERGYASGSFLWVVNNVYFQYYSLIILVVSSVVLVGVSYATSPPSPAQIAGLTRATVSDADRAALRQTWTASDIVASGIVLVMIAAAYLYFVG